MITGKFIKTGADRLARDLGFTAVGLKKTAELNKVLARAGGNLLRKHMRERNQEPNKRGWPKTGFWGELRDSIMEKSTASEAQVIVQDPRMNQKVFGGPITPKRGRSLAIPMRQEAAGVPAKLFEHKTGIKLFVLRARGKSFLVGMSRGVVRGGVSRGKRKGKHETGRRLTIYYILLRRVNQEADPSALPTSQQIHAEMRKAAGIWLKRHVRPLM